MWIVNIEGDDPFVAKTKPAIKRGLDDLHDGTATTISDSKTCVRISYKIIFKDGTEQTLYIVAYKTEYYK